MPTYEYACSSCHHEWEAEQSIKEPSLTECPTCHEQTARRQISRVGGFILKGGGWYSDLYSSASNKPASANASEGAPSADQGKKGESGDKKSDSGGDKKSDSGGDKKSDSGGSTTAASSSTPAGSSTPAA
jgi:putative FmdB family regulatory protein